MGTFIEKKPNFSACLAASVISSTLGGLFPQGKVTTLISSKIAIGSTTPFFEVQITTERINPAGDEDVSIDHDCA
jgi:hypothetical protein